MPPFPQASQEDGFVPGTATAPLDRQSDQSTSPGSAQASSSDGGTASCSSTS